MVTTEPEFVLWQACIQQGPEATIYASRPLTPCATVFETSLFAANHAPWQ